MSQQLELIETESGYPWPENYWPHQKRGCEQVVRAIAADQRRIVLTAPTGAGKSKCMTGLIEWAGSVSRKSVLYTNRRLLFAQIDRVLDQVGIEHGLRAAGYKPALLRDVQIAMTQSEHQAVFKRQARNLHPAGLVLTDEIHCQNGQMMADIHGEHYANGAAICAVTATPLDLEGEWDRLIVACTTSEARKCGALIPAVTYCPDTPDLKHIKNYRVGEDLTDKQNSSAMMRPGVFGRVLTHFKILNPEMKPTVLFGPDVAGSLYFAEQFTKAGIRAAHIDAKQIWLDGEYLNSDDENRARILAMTETGEIVVLCNRFVCLDAETEILTREGWVGKDQITQQHHVANWLEGHVYFEEPIEIIRRPRSPCERMVALETPRRSIRVTEDHELLYRTNPSGGFKRSCAFRLADRSIQLPVSGSASPSPDSIPQPDLLANLQRRITANAFVLRSKGWPADDSRAEAERRIRARSLLHYRQPSELTADECEFVGLWMGDGNKSNLQNGGVEYRLWQPSKYRKIIQRIDALIDRLGFHAIRREGEKENNLGTFRSVQWSFPRGTGYGSQVRHGVFPLEPYLDKNGSHWLWGLSDKQFRSVLHGLWLANGMQHKDNVRFPKSRLMIWSANKTLLDHMQAIAVCRGYRASIRPYRQSKDPSQTLYLLTLTHTQVHACTKYRLQIEDLWQPEDVWCVRTSSGNIITRRRGSVTVMGNCREGIDLPHIAHLIFACVFGSLKTYLQAGGRGLRAHPSMTELCVQDHGGNYVRHGSLNADRQWELGMKGYRITGLRQEGMRERPELEPIICPKCGMARLSGPTCPKCGHQCHKRSRVVVQIDGSLKQVEGPTFKPHRVAVKPDTEAKWQQMYFRAKSAKWNATFNQAQALFFHENHYWPPRNLPRMPRDPADWFEKVADVPAERLQ